MLAIDDRGFVALNSFFDTLQAMEQAFSVLVAAPSSPATADLRLAVLTAVGLLAAGFGVAGHRAPRAYVFLQMSLIGIAMSPEALLGPTSLWSVPSLGFGLLLGLLGAALPKVAIVVIASVAVNRNVYTQYELPLLARVAVPLILTLIFAKAVADDADIRTYVLALSAIQGADLLQEVLLGLLELEQNRSSLLAGLLIFVQQYQRMLETKPPVLVAHAKHD
ncbi:hypothetical protein SPRG_10115 [Saprolegnia parasitica CBS 223.65]|uniref:Uncharacterized protein n=1 Tax=Saprolegnia parasitica (strain CBS 223.65) TaxID=695850 RepID=A0A067C1D1_SAPPC|nr:hypothetical protein SPRG_10115 [Saprolegnia parasitica CBS 223.65]KDO24584.1 hypothetical protein SPRG_10115 [Saprolegnia parasitica CBS 223.65]|eukprot:XP_012204652.1 hypothetical protein SPRG_10115 [Saprolegnia parasitica CBS 223.65]